MTEHTSIDAFLLTRHSHDTDSGLELEYWADSSFGPVRLLFTQQKAVFFAPKSNRVHSSWQSDTSLTTLDLQPVRPLYFSSDRLRHRKRKHLKDQGIPTFESDIRPENRFLMERFISGPISISGSPVQHDSFIQFRNPTLQPGHFKPDPKLASLDIETEGLTGRLYSVAIVTKDSCRVFMVGDQTDSDTLVFCPDERTLLTELFDYIQTLDPDVIIGWNILDFDLQFIARLCRNLNIKVALGRNFSPADIPVLTERMPNPTIYIPGRVVIDGITSVKTAMYRFEDFRLETVASNLLGKGKLIQGHNRPEEITRLFFDSPEDLAAYNLQDCQLVLDIFNDTKLIDFEIERASLSGLPLGRQAGSIAAFDHLYLPRLHRHGFVGPDPNPDQSTKPNPGGYVMESKPGLHENVLVLDFKSLYPSIIRTFHIDPLAMATPGIDPIPGFDNASFSRTNHILPKILEDLWHARDNAKKSDNKPLAHAIKILMNSFYGVLGAPTCRFFNPALASSITLYGQRIIKKSIELIREYGHEVIYSDTDSCFVLLGPDYSESESKIVGENLAGHLNQWWESHLQSEMRLTSFLEIEFETHYLKFFMPTIRNRTHGSKKRYAGLIRKNDGSLDTIYKGLESVRTDWTQLAREFQRDLYERIFLNQPFVPYIRQTIEDLYAGRLDQKLVYKKQLRKPVTQYTKNIPPHVRAAQKLENPNGWIEYVITKSGPEPTELWTSPPDYDHYLSRQITPVADSILQFLDLSLEKITNPQLELF